MFLQDLALKLAKQAAMQAFAEEEAMRAAEHAVRSHLAEAAAGHITVTFTPGDIHLDYAALGKAISETMRGPVEELANEIASHVDVGSVTEAPVGVMMSTTHWGWPVAMVTVMHPAGLAMEAKHGTLKRAAAACGYEVKSK